MMGTCMLQAEQGKRGLESHECTETMTEDDEGQIGEAIGDLESDCLGQCARAGEPLLTEAIFPTRQLHRVNVFRLAPMMAPGIIKGR